MDASDKISRDVMLKRCDISGEKDDDAKERVKKFTCYPNMGENF